MDHPKRSQTTSILLKSYVRGFPVSLSGFVLLNLIKVALLELKEKLTHRLWTHRLY